MLRNYNRLMRLAQEIRKKMSVIVQNKFRDHQSKLIITISNVKLSRDLAYAKVFVSFLSKENNIQSILRVLQNSSGYIRLALGKSMNLRIVPRIAFFYDYSIERVIKIENLLNINRSSIKMSS